MKGHYSTAYDLALLSRKLIQIFQARTSSTPSNPLPTMVLKQHNRNALLWKDSNIHAL